VKIGNGHRCAYPAARREPGGRGSRRQVNELNTRLEVELQALMDEAEAAAHRRRRLPPGAGAARTDGEPPAPAAGRRCHPPRFRCGRRV